ncbi:MAG TPA: DinB family protein [Flavisolibacter sp.]|nr:DinB family protein [Flavisolibacter sp.]
MQTEINFIISQLKDAYEGDPWFGRNAKELLSEIDEQTAIIQFNHQHSILELVWHIITWREFTIDRLLPEKPLAYFEGADWRKLNHTDKTLWPQGLHRLQETQQQLIDLLQKADDKVLDGQVKERSYNFRKLLHGLIQHDIYHLGQIAFINKAVKG